MYFDALVKKTGKKIKDIFPDFSVMVQGGVNFEPYKAKLFESIGKKIDTIELFPASEGFFAFQDSQKEEGLLLNTDSGIFFEFVPAAEIFNENPTRLTLKDVKLNENYVLDNQQQCRFMGIQYWRYYKICFIESLPDCCYRKGETFYFCLW